MRNIVLITIDSLRADHCSFMGYSRKTTPTIDKMAKAGLYFENCVAASVPTPASMFSVFTADYCLAFNNFELKKQFDSKNTIAEVLLKKGFNTIAFNKNPYIPIWKGFGKGFNIFHGLSDDLGKGYKILLYLLEKIKVNPDIRDTILGVGVSSNWEKYYDSLVKQLRESRKPYFVWIILLDTHLPYFPPIRRWSSFYDNFLINYKLRKTKWCGNLDIKEKRKIINAYDDSIRHADSFVNKLWKDAKEEDPIFIIHADHGDGFGEHGFYHHPPMLYEEFIHVPLLIYNANIKGKVEEPASLLSIAPTILKLIGQDNEFPSESLLDGGKDWAMSQIFESGKRKVAVRMKDWKFITGQKEDQLYYLKEDPYEQENLIKERCRLAEELKKIVKKHIKHV